MRLRGWERRLWCWLFEHRFAVWQHFSPTSRRVICTHCGGDWGMNDSVQAMIPWSGDLEKMYQLFGYRIRPRQTRTPGATHAHR